MFKSFSKLILSLSDVSDKENILRVINQLQTNILASLNTLTSKIQNDSEVLTNIELTIGTNIINHKLNRRLAGWKVIRQRGSANIHDAQDANKSDRLTLHLVSSADVTVDLEVF